MYLYSAQRADDRKRSEKGSSMYQIEVEPNAEGKLIIELYGDKYEIVVKEPKAKAKKEEKPAEK